MNNYLEVVRATRLASGHSRSGQSTIREFDDTGHECVTYVLPEKGTQSQQLFIYDQSWTVVTSLITVTRQPNATTTYAFDTVRFLKGAFLPAGYPLSVSPGNLEVILETRILKCPTRLSTV